MKTRVATGRLATAFLLLISLAGSGAGRPRDASDVFIRSTDSASPATAASTTERADAVLSAPDGQREQAIRHVAEANGVGFAAEAPQWKRHSGTQYTKPSCTPADAARSRVRSAIERHAGVALLLAFAASGSATRHTTSLPPPHNA